MQPHRPAALAAALALVVLASNAALAGLPSSNPDNTDMVNGQVRVVVPANVDTWVGGSFTQVLGPNGSSVANAGDLAPFTAAGALDTSITPLPRFTLTGGTSIIYGLSLGTDGILYVAGHFDAVNGFARSNVAAIDPATGALLSFAPHVAPATAILATSTQILVGTGKLLSFQPNGTPTGGFTTPVLHTDASLRQHFTAPQVRRILQVGSTLVIACQCDSIDAVNGTHAVKAAVEINASTGARLPWTPGGLTPTGGAFGLSLVEHAAPGTGNPTIYLAGGGSDFVAAYDFSTGAQVWREDVSGSAQDIVWWQGDLIVGGHFDWTQTPRSGTCGDDVTPNKKCYHSPRLVAISAATGHVVLKHSGAPWNPGICCAYNGVWALSMDPNGTSLHVGGQFTKAGGAWTFNAKANQWQLKGAATREGYARLSAPLPAQPLKVTLSGAGSGTVVSSPTGISCPGICTKSFAGGLHVTLKATAKSASSFTGWTGDCTGVALQCQVTMDAPRNVGATFAKGSACGKILFVSTRTGDADVYAANPDGGATDLTKNAGADTAPAWSRDCSTIAFASTREGGPAHIFLMNPNGSNVQQLTAGVGGDTQPTWSPDGAKIAFVSSRSGHRQIYTITTDGVHLRRLTHDRSADIEPAWSPSGAKILFASNRFGPMNLFAMRSDGSHVKRITHGRKPFSQPSWSPSGAKIAFVSSATGSPQIWVMKSNFRVAVRLTKDGKTDSHPSWSPRGLRIAFASTRSGKVDVWTIGANGSEAMRVTTNPKPDTGPAWS